MPTSQPQQATWAHRLSVPPLLNPGVKALCDAAIICFRLPTPTLTGSRAFRLPPRGMSKWFDESWLVT